MKTVGSAKKRKRRITSHAYHANKERENQESGTQIWACPAQIQARCDHRAPVSRAIPCRSSACALGLRAAAPRALHASYAPPSMPRPTIAPSVVDTAFGFRELLGQGRAPREARSRAPGHYVPAQRFSRRQHQPGPTRARTTCASANPSRRSNMLGKTRREEK